MLTFLFWNLNKKNLAQSIARLINLYNVDVVILAETSSPATSPGTLLTTFKNFHYSHDANCPRIQIYTRFPSDFLPIVQSHNRYTVRALLLPDGSELLIVAAHLISVLHRQEETLNEEVREMAGTIREVEKVQGHRQTLLVGDLNLNPFANGVVSARGLHGVMTKSIAARKERTVQSVPYPFFYNPMWNRFGDQENKPAGTYYYGGSDHICYFWNIFDQVLIRPGLLNRWRDDQLEIPTNDGVEDLVRNKEKSDHLPLIFRLDV